MCDLRETHMQVQVLWIFLGGAAQKNSELVGILLSTERKKVLRESKVGRRFPPGEDVHTLIPRTCDYAVLRGKGHGGCSWD